jgi:hypothetical protein
VIHPCVWVGREAWESPLVQHLRANAPMYADRAWEVAQTARPYVYGMVVAIIQVPLR